MLEFMRRKARPIMWATIILGGLGIASIGGFSASQNRQRGGPTSSTAIASVNGEEILSERFRSRQRQYTDFYQRIYGDRFDDNMRDSIVRQVVETLVRDEVILQEAERRGMKASEKEIREEIKRFPSFQTDGKFDAVKFNQSVDSPQINWVEIEESVRRDILISKLSGLIRDSVKVSDAEVINQYVRGNRKAIIKYIGIKSNDFREGIEPTEDELSGYYENNKESFRLPDKVKLKYVKFPIATQDAIMQYYEEHKADFPSPEQVKASHILIKTEEDATAEAVENARQEAESILKQAQAEGADFADLAKKHSQDEGSASRGGDLGFFQKGQMVPEFEEASFALAPGEIGGPVKTQFGFHIIKVEEKKEAGVKRVEEIYPLLRGILEGDTSVLEASLTKASEFLNQVKAAPGDFEKVAEDHPELFVVETDYFSRGDPVAEVGYSNELSAAAFSLSASGQIYDTLLEIETPIERGYYILKLEDRVDSHVPSFEKVRFQVKTRVVDDKAEELAQGQATLIYSKITKGNFEAIAKEYSLVVETPEPFNLEGQIEGIGPFQEINRAVFGISPGDITSPVDARGNYYLSLLVDMEEIDQAKFEQEKESLQAELLSGKRDDVLNDWYRDIISEYQIEMNPLLVSGS